jgi:hypothetical protein
MVKPRTILAFVLLASSTLFGGWAAYMFLAATDLQGDPDAWGALFLLVCIVLALVGAVLLVSQRRT